MVRFLLPTSCVVCRAHGEPVCSPCRSAIVAAPLDAPEPAVIAYVGTGRALVTALKYRNGRSVVPWLAAAVAARVPGAVFDAVTWAPTSAVRRRARGFDQGELLARAVARRLRVPARRLLVRIGEGGPQTGLGRAQRLLGPTFVAVGRVPHTVLVVDDVVTTGATLAGARTALLAAGARSVQCVAVAAVPSPADAPAPRAALRPSP